MKKDFKDDTWEKFNHIICNKSVILFGASAMGRNLVKQLRILNSSWNIVAFMDNASEKWGKKIEGIEVLNPNSLPEFDMEKTVILITSVFAGNIAEQLERAKVKYYYSYLWLNQEMRDSYFQENIDTKVIEDLKYLMSDEESKEIIDKIVEKRRLNFMDYTDIKTKKNEYFIEDFFAKDNEEVFIDAGAYDGDSIDDFVVWSKGEYKKIYAFEPDSKIVGKLRNNLYKYGDKVEFYQAGVWDKDSFVYLCETDGKYSGKIVEEKNSTVRIETKSLDSTVKDRVTFIKMDIEGSEMKALEGAKSMILKDRPKLAICIYHKLNDLWEIPFWIHELVPEYKMYIRHHGIRCYSTILYATL